MDPARLVTEARRRSGLSLRQLSQRADTSHSAIAAYESGAKSPNSGTLLRLVAACGFELEPRLRRRAPFQDRVARGRELVQVLHLADALPSEHGARIAGRFPSR